ncbi:MAG: hypothetical protein ACKPGI_11550, partial [Verrucomicrobiota bacterium]
MHLGRVDPVFERLVAELERPRPLTPQVLRHLSATYGLGRDEIGRFLDEELPRLSEEETDLALSSLFTPKLQDQAIFADLIGRGSLPASEWPAWVERLQSRPTYGCLVTEQGTRHGVALRTVTLERYVHRLRLDATVPLAVFDATRSSVPTPRRPVLLAIARRAVWSTLDRQQILLEFLANSSRESATSLDDAEALLALMESSEPESVEDVLARIPEWEAALKQ